MEHLPAITLRRTDSEDPDFRALVTALDAELAARDGDEHGFFAQFNGIAALRHVVVAYAGDIAVGCGAFKPHDAVIVEMKRMYVPLAQRGRGIAGRVLAELELWAAATGHRRAILETGIRQPEAIALYKKSGYTIIPNFGQYAGVESSVCFEKPL